LGYEDAKIRPGEGEGIPQKTEKNNVTSEKRGVFRWKREAEKLGNEKID